MPPKKKSNTPPEETLILPEPPSKAQVVDTHTHLASTFDFYRTRYKQGKHTDVFEFVKAMYHGKNVTSIVDVWCEAPVKPIWRDFANSALSPEDRRTKWGGVDYWFAIGVHPHDAKHYNDAVEKDLLEAIAHPRCVSWGEMGLDYHYDNSPREIQRDVFTRQLRHAVRLGKPLTIHTREAEEDTERIMKEIVPKVHPIHVHCFTDSPEFAKRLLDHFPNLYIGITGVITFATNQNTSSVITQMLGLPQASVPPPSADSAAPAPDADAQPISTPPANPERLRILLETDAPYMVPANIYASLPDWNSRQKLPISHTAMIPWTAEFVANLAGDGWTADLVMDVARENAKRVYGV